MCILCTPRPIYRYTYRPTLNRYLTDMSVNVSIDSRPISRPRYVGRHIDWYVNRGIGRVKVDISTDYWQISRSIEWPMLGRYANHWLSAEYRSTVGGILVKSLDCECQMDVILFWLTSKISEGFMFGSCATNSVIIEQHTQVELCLQAPRHK